MNVRRALRLVPLALALGVAAPGSAAAGTPALLHAGAGDLRAQPVRWPSTDYDTDWYGPSLPSWATGRFAASDKGWRLEIRRDGRVLLWDRRGRGTRGRWRDGGISLGRGRFYDVERRKNGVRLYGLEGRDSRTFFQRVR